MFRFNALQSRSSSKGRRYASRQPAEDLKIGSGTDEHRKSLQAAGAGTQDATSTPHHYDPWRVCKGKDHARVSR